MNQSIKYKPLTSLCAIPVGNESTTRHSDIGVESNPKTVTVGYQDRRPLIGTELTNQGRRLIATIPAKDR